MVVSMSAVKLFEVDDPRFDFTSVPLLVDGDRLDA